MFDLTFTVIDREGGSVPLTLPIDQAVIAGWTGRDPVARDKHIAELEQLGIKRPATTPIYYRCAARRLTQQDSIEACGDDSSGEVEFILIGWQGRTFVGLGSDHTDRKVESYGIAVSKQMCAKPIGRHAWRFEDIEPHWDKLILRSYIHEAGARVLYQEGPLSKIREPRELIAGWTGGSKRLPAGVAMFLGTLPAIGAIRPSKRFEMELEDPVTGQRLTHGYDVESLPIVA